MRKTIFIELFSITSAPIFTLKGWVVELLSKKTDLRTVILIPADPTFEEMVKSYQAENIVIEKIEKYFPETFLQKAFVFFFFFFFFSFSPKIFSNFFPSS